MCEIPEQGKKNPKGEDVCFVTERSAAVLDGVGAWYRHGVDPRLYPEDLAERLRERIEDVERNCKDADLATLMQDSWSSTAEPAGSCTLACFHLCTDGETLLAANIGDSGILVIRETGEIAMESVVQESCFNMPYQLGPKSRQKPSDADLFRCLVVPGDTIVLATDGLFSNLTPEEISQFVIEHAHLSDGLASALADRAYSYARDTRRVSPYARRAWDEGFDEVYGGKMDDITVVVAHCEEIDATKV